LLRAGCTAYATGSARYSTICWILHQANDTAAAEVVVAGEITRLRINERENKIIFCLRTGSTVARVDFSIPDPTRAFPMFSWKVRRTKPRQARTKRRGFTVHGG
jgi:hypothetical protein